MIESLTSKLQRAMAFDEKAFRLRYADALENYPLPFILAIFRGDHARRAALDLALMKVVEAADVYFKTRCDPRDYERGIQRAEGPMHQAFAALERVVDEVLR